MGNTEPDESRRSDRSRVAVLEAAWILFEQRGLRDLTVDAVAAQAGVSKATIYRWWPSKSAVVLDALDKHLSPLIPFPDTGSAVEDLRTQLRSVVVLLTTTTAGAAFLSLIAESRHDVTLAKALTERYLAGRRDAAAAVLARGLQRGELRPGLDIPTTIDALYGAVYYRLLVSHARTDTDYADKLVDALAHTLLHREAAEHVPS
ncbi:AcrR family transcriptional regulator [Nakamurella sp. UYEF19]|uniref:TetR/AcrR family transcriptional regulator n=1 Tax=Nakamurella sp. UYEF19 TaxID=1756392 RepID=UPI0033945E1F